MRALTNIACPGGEHFKVKEWLKASGLKRSDVETQRQHKLQRFDDDGQSRREYLQLLSKKIEIQVAEEVLVSDMGIRKLVEEIQGSIVWLAGV